MPPVNTLLVETEWSAYARFKALCEVNTTPVVTGRAWRLAVISEDGVEFLEPEAAFIGYTHSFRRNSVRNTVFPEYAALNNYQQCHWLCENIRLLSRVMVKPEYRKQGLATKIIRESLALIDIPYIECLTFSERISSILCTVGFINYGRTKGFECDYWLYSNQGRPTGGLVG